MAYSISILFITLCIHQNFLSAVCHHYDLRIKYTHLSGSPNQTLGRYLSYYSYLTPKSLMSLPFQFLSISRISLLSPYSYCHYVNFRSYYSPSWKTGLSVSSSLISHCLYLTSTDAYQLLLKTFR